jgi:hypothetical protein
MPTCGNVQLWVCNDETEPSHIRHIIGHCHFNHTDQIAWPSAYIEYAKVWKPPPALDFSVPPADLNVTWAVLDFKLGTFFQPMYRMFIRNSMFDRIFRSKPAKARLRFNLTNLANGYSSTCAALDLTLEPHSGHFEEDSDGGWFECRDDTLREYDAGPTKFRFNPDSGMFGIRQEWECKPNGRERGLFLSFLET